MVDAVLERPMRNPQADRNGTVDHQHIWPVALRITMVPRIVENGYHAHGIPKSKDQRRGQQDR